MKVFKRTKHEIVFPDNGVLDGQLFIDVTEFLKSLKQTGVSITVDYYTVK